jgi:phage gp45-like
MGMLVDLKAGETVIARRGGDEVRITMREKLGNTKARIEIDAPDTVELVPPNRQPKKITPS